MNHLVLFEKFSFWFWGLNTELLKFCHLFEFALNWYTLQQKQYGSSVKNLYQELLLMKNSLFMEKYLFFPSQVTMNSASLWKGIQMWSSKDYSCIPSEKFEAYLPHEGLKSPLCYSGVFYPLKLCLTPQLKVFYFQLLNFVSVI